MAIIRPAPIKGLGTAPEFFIDGVANIQFLGANTRYVLYRNAVDDREAAFRQVVFTAVVPTGALPTMLRQMFSFAIEHRLPVPIHDTTRSV